jgi:hypothetical protein
MTLRGFKFKRDWNDRIVLLNEFIRYTFKPAFGAVHCVSAICVVGILCTLLYQFQPLVSVTIFFSYTGFFAVSIFLNFIGWVRYRNRNRSIYEK